MSQTTAVVGAPDPGDAVAPPGSEFAPLLRTVKGRGLLERRRSWYALCMSANVLAPAGIVSGIVLIGDSWLTLLLAPLLAVLGARTAFMGHDAGHSQKGMEIPDPNGERWGHLRRQVLTSRNIRGSALTDWFLGGLNHQIEHHLFPSMPRPNLRLAQPLVRAHCQDVGIPFVETGLVDSYRQALCRLHEVGKPLRTEWTEWTE
ncbi:fatty acid desaturase [Streptomyces sp. NPDC088350]|uniref:fatty acid desaturase n=1 Tax=Streptomyces sp. NPDC088350 TaxID=3365854 RepID=UPI00380E4532